jgi:hypothetical protein
VALTAEAKVEIAKFIGDCAQRLNAAAQSADVEEHAKADRVLDALAMVYADGDEEYAEAIALAMVEYDIAYVAKQSRDVLVDYYVHGNDSSPENDIEFMDVTPQPGHCRHGNRVGSAPGGEHLCGECEGD